MRISEVFSLGRSQPSLEFVDVDIHGDTRLFVDPRALLSIESDWGAECVALVQSFFDSVLLRMQEENSDAAQSLLASLAEPNETRLGLSIGRPKGRGMGEGLAEATWEALSSSRAVETGILRDLDDTILLVEGIGYDIVSDITTNIIRGPLIEFTQDACEYYGIPLVDGVVSRHLWNRQARRWYQAYVSLPVGDFGPILLVPKSIARRTTTYDSGEYFNHYILPYLQDEELQNPLSSLVEVLRNGRRRVTKKALRERYGSGKPVNLEVTVRNPEILERYRIAKSARVRPPDHQEVADLTGTDPPDWEAFLDGVLSVPTGHENADRYHRAVEALLTALLYPALDLPKREFQIHQGRKRIDISYTNVAGSGFFRWLHETHGVQASLVPVECKNYGTEIGNPELDQLSGRFSDQRGWVGLLIYRGYGDKNLVVQRCRDAAIDGRGFIIALDDQDLETLVAERLRSPNSIRFPYLQSRFNELI